jgi:UDPglucose--hexose-1-phosphate uridylyltransferase
MFYQAAPALGYQEVLIESPRHDQALTSLSGDEVRDVLAACRSRYAALKGHAAVRSVIVFRNHGAKAGVSLGHPHSQVIALESVPPLVRAREAAMFSYYQKNKRCVLCDILAYERNDGSRLAGENSAFLTLVPFAASVPFEMWLLPKRHQPDFGDIGEAEISLLASALRDALIRLATALSDPPYCYMIDTAAGGSSGARYLHWRLRIVPRSTVPAGFELASGLPINPHLPEQNAAILRRQPD